VAEKNITTTAVTWNYNAVDKVRLSHHFGVDAAEQTVPLAAVDWDRSLNNQNRGQGHHVVAAWVEDIALAMLNGDMVDAIVVRQLDDGTLVILDGNHRAKACQELDVADVAAWVVQCDDITAQMIAKVANVGRHGMTVDRRHRLELAVELVRQGYPVDNVARLVVVRPATVRHYIKQQELEVRLSNVFARPVTGGLSTAKVDALAKLEDDQLKVIGPDILTVPTSALTDMVRDIVTAPAAQRQAKAHEVKGAIAAAKAPAGIGQRKAAPVTQTKHALTLLRKNLTKGLQQCTSKEFDYIADQVHELWLEVKAARAAREAAGNASAA